ncbi:MFS transporter [Nonomuraea dietziae]|uniref:MFS family permease n=1 Tax=Nonomuraea dietziae TaxID=65515 RepID=A0A7W5UY23_9ACTN|nr:MFS transporter [Nonomuraea dietziae]MBB3725129.1 MFS family permease [Nonomuraea dietziae]
MSWDRRVVRQVGLAQAALGFTVNSLGACLVLLAADLDSAPEELAWLSSSFGVGLLVAGVTGRWALRPGPRPALLGSALVAAAGTILLATGASAVMAAAGALLLGLGAAGFVLVTPALLGGPDAAAGLARAYAAGSVSALFGPLAIGALAATGLSGRLALLIAVPPLLFLAADARPRRSAAATGPHADAVSVPDAVSVSTTATVASSDAVSVSATATVASSDAVSVADAVSFSDAVSSSDAVSVSSSGSGSRCGTGDGPLGSVERARPQVEVARAPSVWRAAGVWATIVVAVSIEFCFTIWSTTRLQATGLPAGAAAAAATTFLVGMAAGRLAAPRLIARRVPVILVGCGLAAAGTVVVALFDAPVPVTLGLALAGLGVAPFYPVTLARFVQVPGLPTARAAAYGALASGTAILAAPATLAALGAALDLRTAYLVAVLPLALVLAAATLPRRARP